MLFYCYIILVKNLSIYFQFLLAELLKWGQYTFNLMFVEWNTPKLVVSPKKYQTKCNFSRIIVLYFFVNLFHFPFLYMYICRLNEYKIELEVKVNDARYIFSYR